MDDDKPKYERLPDSSLCEASVWPAGRWPRVKQCSRKHSVTIDGHRFCKQHAKEAATYGYIKVVVGLRPWSSSGWDITQVTFEKDPELLAERKRKEEQKERQHAYASHLLQQMKFRKIAELLIEIHHPEDAFFNKLMSMNPLDIDDAIEAYRSGTH